MVFKERLKEKRMEAGLTQVQLAESYCAYYPKLRTGKPQAF